MPSRNCNTRPVSWRIASSPQISEAVQKWGDWAVAWVFVNIIASVDNVGRMEGGKYQLRDWFFPLSDDMFPDKVEGMLSILHDVGLIIRYKHRGVFYMQLPKIGEWSMIKGNMTAVSDFPEPEKKEVSEWESRFNEVYTPCVQRSYNVLAEGKDKGKGKGKDKGKGQAEVEAYQRVVTCWNKTTLPVVIKLSQARMDKLRARWISIHFRENYAEAILKLSASSFAKGEKQDWKATIDWFIANDNNYIKALEGKYDDKVKSSRFKYLEK